MEKQSDHIVELKFKSFDVLWANIKGAFQSLSYLEGCTAPMRDENQLHAANVELIAMKNAEIKYSTIQNWYPGDPETGKGGIYNFVTKRAKQSRTQYLVNNFHRCS